MAKKRKARFSQEQMNIYNAVLEEIKQQMKLRPTLTAVQALIEMLIKRGVLDHSTIMELDDEAISTQAVSDMYAEKFGEKRRPHTNTIRSNALKFGLGSRINKNFQHSKKKWGLFLETELMFKPKE